MQHKILQVKWTLVHFGSGKEKKTSCILLTFLFSYLISYNSKTVKSKSYSTL